MVCLYVVFPHAYITLINFILRLQLKIIFYRFFSPFYCIKSQDFPTESWTRICFIYNHIKLEPANISNLKWLIYFLSIRAAINDYIYYRLVYKTPTVTSLNCQKTVRNLTSHKTNNSNNSGTLNYLSIIKIVGDYFT